MEEGGEGGGADGGDDGGAEGQGGGVSVEVFANPGKLTAPRHWT